jgi:hypothetical protein
MRDITAGMTTALGAGVIRPVLIGRLDIASDPVVAWTGPGVFAPTGTGDAALDGRTFLPLAPFLEMSPIEEDQGIGGPVTLALTGHDLDEETLRQVVRDKRQWRGQPAYLWLGLLAADEKSVIADPVRIKSGVMTGMTVLRNKETAEVRVTLDADLGNARSAPYRWLDHSRIYPSDTFSAYIIKLANKPQGLTGADVRAGVEYERYVAGVIAGAVRFR